jgi:hypothetical protein
VPEGTAVYFHTQAGLIETGQSDFKAYTDKDGFATVNLWTVNPLPDAIPYYDNFALAGRIGGEWVYAQTQGRDGKKIIDSVLVVWSMNQIIVRQVPDSIVMLQHGHSALFTLEVTDANGNPLCDGTTITAAFVVPPGTSGVAFDTYGDIPALIPNSPFGRFPGHGFTLFNFGVTDNSTADVGATTCKITIISPLFGTATIAIPVILN